MYHGAIIAPGKIIFLCAEKQRSKLIISVTRLTNKIVPSVSQPNVFSGPYLTGNFLVVKFCDILGARLNTFHISSRTRKSQLEKKQVLEPFPWA